MPDFTKLAGALRLRRPRIQYSPNPSKLKEVNSYKLTLIWNN